MRPQNQIARERLDSELRRSVPAYAAELAARLNVSIPTIHRIIRERGDQIVRQGSTKSARYALRRALRGQASPIPVYSVDDQGRGQACGSLDLIAPGGSVMNLDAMGWPCDSDHHGGWWDGLPYPLYDMRPQGFLGRNFARQAVKDLGVAQNPDEWSDDDIVYVLSRRGADTVGNLIIGDEAYELWLTSVINPPTILLESGLAERYAEMADIATSQGVVGSSVAGEFPKFTACRTLPGAATSHVIVKFSGADNSGAVRRWSDLLVCEHLALSVLGASTGLSSASSRILMGKGRTFLEAERFDRQGDCGRRAVIALASLDTALIGSGSAPWPDLAKRLADMSLLSGDLVDEILILWWYGKLIANTDMHLGNLSFQFEPVQGYRPILKLAPAYDMLPMLYAPLSGGEVPIRKFEPALPLPREQAAWKVAFCAALKFWQIASDDVRISESFRQTCRENHDGLVIVGGRHFL